MLRTIAAMHRPRLAGVVNAMRIQPTSQRMWMSAAGSIKHRHEYQPVPWSVRGVDMSVDLREETATVTTKLTLRRQRSAAGAGSIVLDAENLEILSVKVDGTPTANFTATADTLCISDVPRHEDDFIVETVVRIEPAKNTQLSGMYQAGPMILTQCEAEGFRRITPYFDRPDVMAPFKCRIEADESFPILLSNGNKVSAGSLPGSRHFAVWEDPYKKPAYLFALVAGDLGSLRSSFKTASGRDVALEIFCERQNTPKLSHAMGCLKSAMECAATLQAVQPRRAVPPFRPM
jgi:aminopeptidase N